jgi:uncharacterized membrane protein YgcG
MRNFASHRRLGFVRVFPALAIVMAGSLHAFTAPIEPGSHVSDPDFVLSPESSIEISRVLLELEKENVASIYLALYSSTTAPPLEMAGQLSEAWLQRGPGAVIVFAIDKKQASVVPSLQLSDSISRNALTRRFADAARPGISAGDFSRAAIDGTSAVAAIVREVTRVPPPPPSKKWMRPRNWLLTFAAVLALLGSLLLRASVRAWVAFNLFDHQYRFPKTAPALRFNATRSGGQMATINFRSERKARPLKRKDF